VCVRNVFHPPVPQFFSHFFLKANDGSLSAHCSAICGKSGQVANESGMSERVHACVRTCVCACALNVHDYVCTCARGVCMCACACMCVYVCVCVYVCERLDLRLCKCVRFACVGRLFGLFMCIVFCDKDEEGLVTHTMRC